MVLHWRMGIRLAQEFTGDGFVVFSIFKIRL